MIKVLDKGYVNIIEKYGTDLTVINSARVSFDDSKKEFDDQDRKLLNYLWKNKHYSPFRHIFLHLEIYAPEFVMRQWYKHVVGIETTSMHPTKDHGWSEISGRYKEINDFYYPSEWREQSLDNKQGSSGLIENQELAHHLFENLMKKIIDGYHNLLWMNIAKEQARIVLPLNMYTKVRWTASWQALCNFISLREESHAQYEIREYAKIIKLCMAESFPECYAVYEKEGYYGE